MKLYINQDIIIVNNKFENTIFIYDRSNRIKSIINEDMFEILKLIYNENGITISQLNTIYDGISEVINQLLEMNVLKTKPQKRCHNLKVLKKINSARLFVEVTDRCNLRCKHCYGDFKIENHHVLSIDMLDKLITQAIEMNIYQFDITGGEPLLYKNLDLLLEKLYNAGMLVTIFTNLTIQSDVILTLFEKYRVKKIITSIDSHINKVHDTFRGVEEALNKTVSNIKKLKKTSIEIGVNTMVGTHNQDSIDQTILFLKELDVPCVLDAIIPNGRANILNENTFKSVQIIHELYKREDLNVELKITDCGVGNRFLYIKSNGNICLCPSLITNDFIFGNLNDDNFDLNNCWKKMINKYGNLKCTKECSKKKICNGGCRARALLFKNNLHEKDLNSCILCGECRFNEIK